MTRRLTASLCAVILAGLLTVLVAPGTAWACSCMAPLPPGQQAAAWFADADLAFIGTPGQGRPPVAVDGTMSSAAPVHWPFTVDTVLEGDVPSVAEVLSPLSEGSCGIVFTPGERYVVFGLIEPDGITAELCSGTVRFGRAAPDFLTAPNTGARPPPPETVTPPPSPTPTQAGRPTGTATADEAQSPAGNASFRVLLTVAVALCVVAGGWILLRRNARRGP